MKRDKSTSFKRSTVLPWVEIRVADQSTACYSTHSHDEFSFGIIEHGNAVYRNRNQTYSISTGDIVTINPADVHSCNPKQETWSYAMLFVDTLKMGKMQSEVLTSAPCKANYDFTPFRSDVERSPLVKTKYLNLFSALVHEAPELHVQTCMYNFIEASVLTRAITREKLLAKPVKRVQEKLLDEINSSHALGDLAQEAGMSRYQFLRTFKAHYGLPPYAYLLNEKIKRAKTMLKSGCSLAEVAHILGFSDQAHFQRQFKKHLAVTPKYYQSFFD